MRRSLLLLAALPLLLSPPALAEDADDEKACPPPEITPTYDTTELAVHVKLPATGCPAREHNLFMVSAQITRFDENGPTNRVDRAVMCGPFRSAADRSPDEPEHAYFCELDVTLAHPDVETIRYAIDVAYPGETSDRHRFAVLACSSDGETAACDE
jgi:hypothetical protein